MQLVYVALSSPLLYDFYNYSPKHPEFTPLLNEFLQVCLNLHLLFFSFPACLWFYWWILIGVFFLILFHPSYRRALLSLVHCFSLLGWRTHFHGGNTRRRLPRQKQIRYTRETNLFSRVLHILGFSTQNVMQHQIICCGGSSNTRKFGYSFTFLGLVMLTVPCSKGVLSFWKMNGSQYICLLEKYLGMELKD